MLVFLFLAPAPVVAHNGAVALAYPLDGITIDGNLDDWPDDMRRYPIALVEYGDPIKDKDDFEAWFRIAYSTSQNAVYVAVEVRDDSAVWDELWENTDGCNVYVDSLHAEEDSSADQFITYGYHHQSARVAKPALAWEWKRQDGLCRYEWRLNFDTIGGDFVRLKSGMAIGFDIAICDKDSDGSFSWVSWGRGADKRSSEERCGEVVLVATGVSTGWLDGRVTWQNTLPKVGGESLSIRSLKSGDLWVRTRTTREGTYRVELPEGRYKVEAGRGRRRSASKVVQIRNSEQVQVDLDILGAKGLTVSAGAGTPVRAVCAQAGGGFSLITPYGLTNIAVKAIVQSDDGHLWLGTNQGLARYDGELFTLFTAEDGLVRGLIRALEMDRLGRLWIGTEGGICAYDGETFTHFTVEDGLLANEVRALLADSAGRLWIGTSRGASIYDGNDLAHLTTSDGLRFNNIWRLLEDSSGRIWLGTSFGGVSIYDGGTITNLDRRDGLAGNRIRALLEDSLGRMWIGTYDRGLSLYDGAGFTNFTEEDGLADNHVSALLADSTGRIWIGGILKGLSVRDHGTFSRPAITDVLASTSEWTFLEDRQGNLWAGTDSGLIRYDNALMTPVTANALPSRDVVALVEDSAGHIWIGTQSGVSVYDGKSVTRFTGENGLAGSIARSLLQDSAGRIWIATGSNGVSVYDGNSITRFDKANGLPGNQVSALMEDRTSRVWIAASHGISVYDDGKFSHFTIEDGLVDNNVGMLLEDRTGRVWMGTEFGISVYDGTGFTSITKKDGLVDNFVTALLEDSLGRIWIGTEKNGVSVYDGESFSSITEQDGLVSNRVRALLEDRTGHIWIGTLGGGVSRYDGKSFQSLTHKDGLPGDSVRALLEDHGGHIWIGTTTGITRYRPGHTPPSVALVDVVTNRRFGPIDRIELSSTQSLLAFEYRSLSFKTRIGGMVYRYRLKGYETEWRTTHDRRVEYHDLPRGNYTFELQAVDRDLSYSDVPVRVAVAVHLPYGGIAFWSVVAVALALGHWQIIRIRRRGARLRAARDELELRVKQRTSELTRSNVMLIEEMAERQKVEAALAESEQRFRKFFENEPEYCYMVSPQGIILEVNSAALNALGYEREDLAGKPLNTIYAPECHQKMNQLLTTWKETGEVRDQEMTIITRDGDRRTVLLHASCVLDENGKTLHSVSIQRDITEQRRLEQQQSKQQKQLAHVSRLTVAGELASGIAHELNQPLGAIATFSDGCKRLVESGQADCPEVRDGLMQISAQAKRGGEIIRRMRRFVRKHELEFSPADLNSIVRDACGLVQIGEAGGRIELSLELAEEPLTVFVDKIQIQQVIMNLLQNGLDSMSETQGAGDRLTVRTARLSPEKVEAAVTDEGRGLAGEGLERVFEPFLTTKPGGLGIGLSISRSIVEAHGGHIWARSNPDRGMTFGFELPARCIERTGAIGKNAN